MGLCSAELVVVCVMDVLLGGGSSFSAGGPGKGMYSRLYRVSARSLLLLRGAHSVSALVSSHDHCRACFVWQEVLNVHHWVEAANAYCVQFTHQGLFGIFGSAEPKQAGSLVNLLCLHLIKLASTFRSISSVCNSLMVS